MTTYQKANDISRQKSEAFGNEFSSLCKKYGFQGLAVGSSGNFDLEEGGSWSGGFCIAAIDTNKIAEATAIIDSYYQAKNDVILDVEKGISKIFKDRFELSDEQFENIENNLIKFLEFITKGVQFHQEGNLVCATFKDFINLQESFAGFGKDETEAKKDLFKTIASSI